MRSILVIIFSSLFYSSNAQLYLEPFVGYALDVRPKQNLHMVNTGIQISLSKKSDYIFSAGIVHSFGIRRKEEDSSFTSNPSLPIYAKSPKTTHASFLGVYTNHGFRLFKINNRQFVNFDMSLGIRLQRIIVNYRLENADYVVLNPGAEAKRIGIYAGTGFTYLYLLEKGRIFFQTSVVTPSIRRRREQPDRFNIAVPMSFNAGYSLELKKRKNRT